MRPLSMIREILLRVCMLKLSDPNDPRRNIWEQEKVALKKQLRESDIEVVDQEVTTTDVHIQYRKSGRLYDAEFFRPMLEAEAIGRIREGM